MDSGETSKFVKGANASSGHLLFQPFQIHVTMFPHIFLEGWKKPSTIKKISVTIKKSCAAAHRDAVASVLFVVRCLSGALLVVSSQKAHCI